MCISYETRHPFVCLLLPYIVSSNSKGDNGEDPIPDIHTCACIPSTILKRACIKCLKRYASMFSILGALNSCILILGVIRI